MNISKSNDVALVAATLPASVAPRLLICVHTEEEFDWSKSFKRENTSVAHLAGVKSIHDICVLRGYRPTYFCTYPVVRDRNASTFLKSMLSDGSGEIGAHQHPWVCPPFDEEVSSFNSYPGNLPKDIEAQKLLALTNCIGEAFGAAPKAYLAGRYGFGPHSADVLRELGYRVDFSCAPGWDYQSDGGPDYSDSSCASFWEPKAPGLLRIPHTGGYIGKLCQGGSRKIRVDRLPFSKPLRLPGIASRLGLVSRSRLTLEGADPKHMRCLARDLFECGARLFTLSYHSPSADIGYTPYVKSPDDLAKMKTVLMEFLDFFSGELGGQGAMAHEAYTLVKQYEPRSNQSPLNA